MQDPIASVLTDPSRTTVTAVRECCASRQVPADNFRYSPCRSCHRSRGTL